jgi:hypothetical protein
MAVGVGPAKISSTATAVCGHRGIPRLAAEQRSELLPLLILGVRVERLAIWLGEPTRLRARAGGLLRAELPSAPSQPSAVRLRGLVARRCGVRNEFTTMPAWLRSTCRPVRAGPNAQSL